MFFYMLCIILFLRLTCTATCKYVTTLDTQCSFAWVWELFVVLWDIMLLTNLSGRFLQMWKLTRVVLETSTSNWCGLNWSIGLALKRSKWRIMVYHKVCFKFQVVFYFTYDIKHIFLMIHQQHSWYSNKWINLIAVELLLELFLVLY